MPWQSVSSLFVVGGAFNAVAGLVAGITYLADGVSVLRSSDRCPMLLEKSNKLVHFTPEIKRIGTL